MLQFSNRTRPILFMNAQVVGPDGIFASSLRIENNRIVALNESPRRNDVPVNLHGAFIFPGLINSHEHLEHNHYGRVKFREKYANASEWIEDMSPRLQSDPRLLDGKSRPLADRLFIGGLKNLLSGTTTIAHHNPLYRQLRRTFPVRVVQNYSWAHSLYLQDGNAGANGEKAGGVLARYRATPKKFPFVIHLAEGVDEMARAEFHGLEVIGCLDSNTVLVHGIGLSLDNWIHLTKLGAGLIWCPASNMFLFGQTIPARQFLDSGGLEQLALGSDSRLTGSRDLLDEIRLAFKACRVTPYEIFCMVTRSSARLLRLPYAGKLAAGLPADLLIIPPLKIDPFETLVQSCRKDILLVAINGKPYYGAPQMSETFVASGIKAVSIQVDGENKLLGRKWGLQLQRCSIQEKGVVCLAN